MGRINRKVYAKRSKEFLRPFAFFFATVGLRINNRINQAKVI
jgi:hypothetical protein